MLTGNELESIRIGFKNLKTGFELIICRGESDSQLLSKLLSTAKQIKDAVGEAVQILEDPTMDLAGRPGLTLSCRDRSNIHYLAAPEGFETPPFVQTLLDLAKGEMKKDTEWKSDIDKIVNRAELLVFIAPTCPHCQQMVRQASDIALASELVSVSIIDIHEFHELAESFLIRSVPHTVLDRGMSWIGVVKASDLVKQILLRGSDEHEKAVFRSTVENGRLDRAKELILDMSHASCFAATWKQSTTRLRMGLMLVTDEVLDSDPAALDDTVLQLIDLLDSEDASFRGDTADLLGKIGNPLARKKLEALQNDPNPDVAEIAAEALDGIRERGVRRD
jgi:alkyl hydroperoxide reductase subunit AhpF